MISTATSDLSVMFPYFRLSYRVWPGMINAMWFGRFSPLPIPRHHERSFLLLFRGKQPAPRLNIKTLFPGMEFPL